MPDPYWVCEECGHYVSAPERAAHCESCGSHSSNLTECPDLEAAQDESEIIVGLIMEGSGER